MGPWVLVKVPAAMSTICLALLTPYLVSFHMGIIVCWNVFDFTYPMRRDSMCVCERVGLFDIAADQTRIV